MLQRKEFPRCTPEAVGISSDSVARFVARMDDGFTEMHSLMIMRHGKICAEGWWAPYAPGLRHTMMSQTKTFTGTAIGIALQEGLLTLDDRIVDIFPEYVPEDADEKLNRITIRHLLTMCCGMAQTCRMDEDWLRNFFATPVVYEPGTSFFYNDSAVPVLCAILRRKTGLHILDYLRPRLFDKIGIDTDNLTWFDLADGCAFGAGGLHATTEDALRLMKLYMDGGVWEGERILPEAYVREATSPQNMTEGPNVLMEGLPADNCCGYGYLMWMSHVPGVFRAEGARGQITLVDPARDMILSFTESAKVQSPASQDSMDRCWEFLEEIDPQCESLPENPTDSGTLQAHLSALAIARPPYAPFGTFPQEGKWYQVVSESGNDGIHPENLFYEQLQTHPKTRAINGITRFAFHKEASRLVRMDAVINGCDYTLHIPTDGTRRLHTLPVYYVSQVALCGYWKDAQSFAVRFRWVETIFERELVFTFAGDACTVTVTETSGNITAPAEVRTAILCEPPIH